MKSTQENTLTGNSIALQTRSKDDDGTTLQTTIFGGTNENSVILQQNKQIKREVISKSTLDVNFNITIAFRGTIRRISKRI